MSAHHEENPAPISKVLRVRHAANTLGISERTVYRRLRSGKLEQLPTEIPLNDNVMTFVSEATVIELISTQIDPHLSKLACQNDMTNDKLSALRQELENRDAQIQTLLENQKELTLTIQKLQAQMFELARLALLQPTKVEEKPAEITLAADLPSGTPASGWRSWLRKRTKRA